MEVFMDFGLGKVIEWDGEQGLIEDEQGEVIRFTQADIRPKDLQYVEVGTVVVVTDDGYLELTSQGFSHYTDSGTDQMQCVHMDIRDGFCEDCGEKMD